MIINQTVSNKSSQEIPSYTITGGVVTQTQRVLTAADFAGITQVNGSAMSYAFYYHQNVSGVVEMNDLETVAAGGFQKTFDSCNISAVSFPNLTSVGNLTFENTFSSSLAQGAVTAKFYSLKTMGYRAFYKTFYGRARSDIYFYAITANTFSTYTSQFEDIADNTGTYGLTLHFPNNMASTIATLTGYPDFGGQSGSVTLSFDLPATVTLTCANTVDYERNPAQDTSSALAWRVNGSGPKSTPYYTSGTTDPAVGDTIYSDADCTVTVTTIDSIA